MTTADHTTYGLPHSFASNKRDLNIDIDIMNPENNKGIKVTL
jgi:hypothetical protein